jgi:hypothetical protein
VSGGDRVAYPSVAKGERSGAPRRDVPGETFAPPPLKFVQQLVNDPVQRFSSDGFECAEKAIRAVSIDPPERPLTAENFSGLTQEGLFVT